MRAAQVSCDNMLVFQGYGIICKIVAYFEGALPIRFLQKRPAYLNSIFYLYEKERYLFMKWQLKLKMVSNVIYGRAFDGGGM